VADLARDYWAAVSPHYSPGERAPLKAALGVLRALAGPQPAAAFGPNALRLVRAAMVAGDPTATPPRRPWARSTVNSQVVRIRTMFKWAAGRELIPAAVWQALQAVEPLKAGRSAARETAPVAPVAAALVEAALVHAPAAVADLARLQLLTGARAGELLALTRADLDMSGPVWFTTLSKHKTAHLGRRRIIALGPKAQALLRPRLLAAGPADPLFPTPAGTAYTRTAYTRAIARACRRAADDTFRLQPAPGQTWPAFEAGLGEAERAEMAAWRKMHHWHPHRLRHSFATEVRRRFGLEAAQVALGHSTADTAQIYAERDQAAAAAVARKIG
jgi:integrase